MSDFGNFRENLVECRSEQVPFCLYHTETVGHSPLNSRFLASEGFTFNLKSWLFAFLWKFYIYEPALRELLFTLYLHIWFTLDIWFTLYSYKQQ